MSEYSRVTEYLFTVYQTSQIRIPVNQKIFEYDRILMNISNSEKNWAQCYNTFYVRNLRIFVIS
jgi:hypothetical protein